MVLIDSFLQPSILDMGINLCSCNVAMSQQLLNNTQICPAIQQMCRKAMTKAVCRQALIQPQILQALLDQRMNILPCQDISSAV